MPNITCMCKKRISYGEIPCKDEWLVISDVNFDEFSNDVDAEKLYARMTHMLKCPSCGRLLVFWDGFDKEPFIYSIEVPPQV